MVFLGLGCVRYLTALYDEMAIALNLRLICIDRYVRSRFCLQGKEAEAAHPVGVWDELRSPLQALHAVYWNGRAWWRRCWTFWISDTFPSWRIAPVRRTRWRSRSAWAGACREMCACWRRGLVVLKEVRPDNRVLALHD